MPPIVVLFAGAGQGISVLLLIDLIGGKHYTYGIFHIGLVSLYYIPLP